MGNVNYEWLVDEVRELELFTDDDTGEFIFIAPIIGIEIDIPVGKFIEVGDGERIVRGDSFIVDDILKNLGGNNFGIFAVDEIKESLCYIKFGVGIDFNKINRDEFVAHLSKEFMSNSIFFWVLKDSGVCISASYLITRVENSNDALIYNRYINTSNYTSVFNKGSYVNFELELVDVFVSKFRTFSKSTKSHKDLKAHFLYSDFYNKESIFIYFLNAARCYYENSLKIIFYIFALENLFGDERGYSDRESIIKGICSLLNENDYELRNEIKDIIEYTYKKRNKTIHHGYIYNDGAKLDNYTEKLDNVMRAVLIKLLFR